MCQFGSGNGFGSAELHSLFAVAGERRCNAVDQERVNKFNLTAAAAHERVLSDCCLLRPIVMIGPGGLLLVVPHLFAVPTSISCVRFAKK
jgi:hypothetical protein